MTDLKTIRKKPKRKPGRTYGMRCYGCAAEVEVPTGKDAHTRLENKAKDSGWGIGFAVPSGQACFSCPNCASGLFKFKIFHGTSKTKVQTR